MLSGSIPSMPTAGTPQEVARQHIKIHAKGNGGNTKFTCNYCDKEFTGSLTRQLAHLTGTPGSGVSACQKNWAICCGLCSYAIPLKHFFAFLAALRPKAGAAVRAPGAVLHPHPHPHECNYVKNKK